MGRLVTMLMARKKTTPLGWCMTMLVAGISPAPRDARPEAGLIPTITRTKGWSRPKRERGEPPACVWRGDVRCRTAASAK